MYKIRCAEIWGGVTVTDREVATSGVKAIIFSSASGAEKGGDIYYFSVCSDDMVTRIVLADLRGHGESASRLSQWLYESLEHHMDTLDGAGVLTELNQLVCAHGFEAITTAVVVSYYDGTLYYSYAGHPPAFLLQTGTSWNPLTLPAAPGIANLPLGMMSGVRYDQARLPVKRGDRLFLYTDGVAECPGNSGSLYGDEAMQQTLEESAAQPISGIKQRIHEDLLAYHGGPLTHDDATFMVAEIL